MLQDITNKLSLVTLSYHVNEINYTIQNIY